MANNMKSFIEVKGNEEVVKMVDQRIERAEELSTDKEFDNGNGVVLLRRHSTIRLMFLRTVSQ